MKFKYLIDNIIIDLWAFGNFASMKSTINKKNVIQWWIYQKFISDKKKLHGVIAILDMTKFVAKTLSYLKQGVKWLKYIFTPCLTRSCIM